MFFVGAIRESPLRIILVKQALELLLYFFSVLIFVLLCLSGSDMVSPIKARDLRQDKVTKKILFVF
jgi:hypothetical protein